jgi:hypothetical protein
MRLKFKTEWAHRVQSALRRRARAPVVHIAKSLASVPVNAAWDEAFLRVESYLRAHHIESRVLLNRLTTDILGAARLLATEHPHEAPVTLAIQVAQARIGEWLVQAMGEGDWADERFRARGRLAVLMAEIPRRCPERFLSNEELPPATRTALVGAKLQPGPEVRLASMPSSPLEFPLAEAVDEKWTTFSRSAFFSATMSWLAIAGIAGVVWLITR